MALPLSNNFETGIADGTTITIANSDDSTAGNAFDAVNIDTAIVFDSAHVMHGSKAGKFTVGTPGGCNVQWSTSMGSQTQIWGRVYLFKTVTPAANQWLVRLENATNTVGLVYLGSDADLYVFDGPLTTSAAAGLSLSNNLWLRFEFHLVCSATVGVLEAKVFDGDNTTPLGTAGFTTGNTRTNVTIVQFGETAANTNQTFWLDAVHLNSTAYPGPELVGGGGGTSAGRMLTLGVG